MKLMFPPMHTAEHLLNQTMIRMFGMERCFSAHIEEKKSKCDYHFERDLTPAEATEIEQKMNDVIQQNLPVTTHEVTKEDAVKVYYMKKVPEDAGDIIRIVTIGDYDVCPCIGDHVHNTLEIGTFKLISHSFESGVLRIRFRLNPAAPV